MRLKQLLKMTFCGLLALILPSESMAFNRANPQANDYLEPQMIVPGKDRAFLKSINLADVNLESESILNILFLAQDKRGPSSRAQLRTVRDGNESTPGLASWMGYGIFYDQSLPEVFASIFDQYFSRTFALSEFNKATTVNGKNLIARAAYRNGISPVSIVQFGPGIGSFSIFQNNQFQHFGGNGHLRQLNPKIQILTPPASLPATPNWDESH